MENETDQGFFKKFNLELFLSTNRYILIATLTGLILIGLGAFYVRSGQNVGGTKVEVLSEATEAQKGEFVVEVVGAVEAPGVYKLPAGSRVDDALISAGGFSVDADRNWVEKTLNRAAKVADGQKIYIPSITNNEKLITNNLNTGGAGQSSLVNINTASLTELDKLPGIGPVYGQNIIDHRPYSTVEELVSKGALKKNVFEKIKDKISVY